MQVGLGGTTVWKGNSLTAGTAVALFFQPSATKAAAALLPGTPLCFQVCARPWRLSSALHRTQRQYQRQRVATRCRCG